MLGVDEKKLKIDSISEILKHLFVKNTEKITSILPITLRNTNLNFLDEVFQ